MLATNELGHDCCLFAFLDWTLCSGLCIPGGSGNECTLFAGLPSDTTGN